MSRTPQSSLAIGELLSQGGEGSVYQLPLQPHLVFKSYRTQGDRSHLDELVSWPERLSEREAATVGAYAAWPMSVVSGAADEVAGILMPRAPRRFSVRHSDGQRRLATLSYLTCDPARPARAYGVVVPPACGPERFGIVLALARLLAAFDSVTPSVSHGDLSTKNVLWSVEREPEVYVIDCDSAELDSYTGYPPRADLSSGPARRRAMTPNWDDPAVEKGRNPTVASDRYSLGLIFLRVVGAANFPIQSRQRKEGKVRVDFPVPPGPASRALVDAGGEIWDLCARALSVEAPDSRPVAAEWIDPLMEIIAPAVDGAEPSKPSRRSSPTKPPPSRLSGPLEPQGSSVISGPLEPRGSPHVGGKPADVSIVARSVSPRSGAGSDRLRAATARGLSSAGSGGGESPFDTSAVMFTGGGPPGAPALKPERKLAGPSLRLQSLEVASALIRWWIEAHRAAVSTMLRGGSGQASGGGTGTGSGNGSGTGSGQASVGGYRARGAAAGIALLLADLLILGLVAAIAALLLSPLTR